MPPLNETAQLPQQLKLASEMTHGLVVDNEAARKERWGQLAEFPGQAALGLAAGIIGAPVDIMNLALKPFQLDTAKPVLGSEWIGERLKAKTGSPGFITGTVLPVGPEGIAKGAALGIAGIAGKAGRAFDALSAKPVLKAPEELTAALTKASPLTPEAALEKLKVLPSEGDEVRALFKPADELDMAEALAAKEERADDFELSSISPSDPSLVTYQDTVSKATLKKLLAGEHKSREAIQVVQLRGQKLIMDGNHRLTAAKLRGDSAIEVQLLSLDPPAGAASAAPQSPLLEELGKIGKPNPEDPAEVLIGKAGVSLKENPDGSAHLNFVRSLEQGGGHASKALNEVAAAADKTGTTLTLEAAPLPHYAADKKGALSKSQLKEWYSRHGFVEVKKRGEHDHMVRFPRVPTDTPEFKQWFKGSKVATAEGAPLEVYHGTPDIDKLEFTERERGIFFTSNPKLAEGYARSTFGRGGNKGAAVPAYLSMKNPLVIDALGKRNDNIPVPWAEWKPKVFGNLPKDAVSVEDAFKYAKEHGHDGLVVRNVVDTNDITAKTKGDVFAVISPEQIKTAAGVQKAAKPVPAKEVAKFNKATAKPVVKESEAQYSQSAPSGQASLQGLASTAEAPWEGIWRPADTVQFPAGTQYSPTNKYLSNPNYNTALDSPGRTTALDKYLRKP